MVALPSQYGNRIEERWELIQKAKRAVVHMMMS